MQAGPVSEVSLVSVDVSVESVSVSDVSAPVSVSSVSVSVVSVVSEVSFGSALSVAPVSSVASEVPVSDDHTGVCSVGVFLTAGDEGDEGQHICSGVVYRVSILQPGFNEASRT